MAVQPHSERRIRRNCHLWAGPLAILALACVLAPAAQAEPSERLIESFHQLDIDGDGQVSAVEFRTKKIHVFSLRDTNYDQMLQPTEIGADSDQFRAADQDGDGQISGFEFVESSIGRFETYDTDGNGSLTVNELMEAASSSATSP